MADVAVLPHDHSALADSSANWVQIPYSGDSYFPPGVRERRWKCCRKDYRRLPNWRYWQPLLPPPLPPLPQMVPFPAIPSARVDYSRMRHADRVPLHGVGVGDGDGDADGADGADDGDAERQQPLLPPLPMTDPYDVLYVGRDSQSRQPLQRPRQQLAFAPQGLRFYIDPPMRHDSNASLGDRKR